MVPCQLSWPRTFCTGGKPCRQQPLFPHEYTQTCAISSSNMVHKRRNGGSSGLQHFLTHPEQPQPGMRLFTYIKGAWAQLKLNNLSYLCSDTWYRAEAYWDKTGAKRRNTDEHNHCSVLTKAAVTVGAACPELLSAFLHCLPLLLLESRRHTLQTHTLSVSCVHSFEQWLQFSINIFY